MAALATRASRHRRAQGALVSLTCRDRGQSAGDRSAVGLGMRISSRDTGFRRCSSSPHQPGRFESWLVRSDERCRIFAISLRVGGSILELSYLLCYVLVPVAFVFVWANGTADVDRFWTAVLLSGFLCYGSLPWLVSRPPRTLTGDDRPSGCGRE